MRPGHPERLEDQYRRHSTLAVLAGWDVRTGRVVAMVRRRRRGQEFLQLLGRLRRVWPRGRLVIILDKLSIHTTPEVRAWVAAQDGRVRFEFLPLHASWPNQVEVWFSILERQALVRASDTTYEPAPIGSPALSAIGTGPPAPSAGRSRAIPCTGRVGWNFWDTVLVEILALGWCRSSPRRSSQP